MFDDDLYAFLAADGGLAALVADRIYPTIAAASVAKPYLTWQHIDGPRPAALDGPSGMVRSTIQFDAWATSQRGAALVFHALRAALNGYRGDMGSTRVNSVILDTRRDGFEDETRLHRVSADFVIWHEE